MERKIEDALMAMGVPANISGFNYIKEAALIRERDGANVVWMGVYAEIAKNTERQLQRLSVVLDMRLKW